MGSMTGFFVGSILGPCNSMNFCMKDSRGARESGFFAFATTISDVFARPVISRRRGKSSSDPYKERDSVRSCPIDVAIA